MQILIDADNIAPARLRVLLDALADLAPAAAITTAGRATALARTAWPRGARQIVATGWQRADLALAEVYRRDADPLVLASGDGDFGLLASGHPGPVLVVSGAPSYRLVGGTTVVDPALEGPQRLRGWLLGVQADQMPGGGASGRSIPDGAAPPGGGPASPGRGTGGRSPSGGAVSPQGAGATEPGGPGGRSPLGNDLVSRS